MGTTERRERQKAELREHILSAASRIIADEGFDALTMRKIADAIEYSPATLYLHFASRDEIALELVRAGFAELVRGMAPAAALADPLERVRAIGRAYLAFAEAHPHTYRLIFMEEERYAAPLFERLAASDDDTGDRAFGILLASVTELVERGIYRPLDPQAAAAMLWAALHGIAALKLSCSDYPFAGSIAAPGELMIDILTRGLRAEPGDGHGT